MEVDIMEELFKGLVQRAQYYEQFEIFRNINLSGRLWIYGQLTLV